MKIVSLFLLLVCLSSCSGFQFLQSSGSYSSTYQAGWQPESNHELTAMLLHSTEFSNPGEASENFFLEEKPSAGLLRMETAPLFRGINPQVSTGIGFSDSRGEVSATYMDSQVRMGLILVLIGLVLQIFWVIPVLGWLAAIVGLVLIAVGLIMIILGSM
jgi:hypothetical protein